MKDCNIKNTKEIKLAEIYRLLNNQESLLREINENAMKIKLEIQILLKRNNINEETN